MEFRIDAVLPATAAQLWAIFFDVQRVAALIPGCENVTEIRPLEEFSAVMKQKIGPFKLEVPTRITIDTHTVERQVVLLAAGSDRFTGTTLDVRMKVDLEEQPATDGKACRLAVDASMQVAGRLASLGYPIVKKRSEELFGEFERRLRQELSGVRTAQPQALPAGAPLPADEPVPAAAALASAPASVAPAAAPVRSPDAARDPRHRVELVLLWPRVGISLAAGIAVAHGAVAFGQSPWWWVAAPLLGVAAGLGRREA